MDHDRPGRGASASPASPLDWYRCRHDNTVVTVESTSSAILVLAIPSAASRTIRPLRGHRRDRRSPSPALELVSITSTKN